MNPYCRCFDWTGWEIRTVQRRRRNLLWTAASTLGAVAIAAVVLVATWHVDAPAAAAPPLLPWSTIQGSGPSGPIRALVIPGRTAGTLGLVFTDLVVWEASPIGDTPQPGPNPNPNPDPNPKPPPPPEPVPSPLAGLAKVSYEGAMKVPAPGRAAGAEKLAAATDATVAAIAAGALKTPREIREAWRQNNHAALGGAAPDWMPWALAVGEETGKLMIAGKLGTMGEWQVVLTEVAKGLRAVK